MALTSPKPPSLKPRAPTRLSAKGALLSLVTGSLLLGGILLGRTFWLSASASLPVPSLLPAPDMDAAVIAKHLSTAVQFQTISHEKAPLDQQAFGGFIDFLAATYPRVHQQLTLTRINNYSLLFHWSSGTAQAPVLLSAHYDVVPVIPGSEHKWQHPPFAGVIADGYVWGRGTMDDKSAVICMLEAVEKLLAEGKKPSQDVYLAFTHDEEIGSVQGSKAITAYLKEHQIQPAWSLDEGSFVLDGMVPGATQQIASINVAEKGYLTLELIASAAGGHSSMPPKDTAVTQLARALVKLQDQQVPGGLDGVSGEFYQQLSPALPLFQRVLLSNQWLFGPVLEHELSKLPAGNAMLRTTTAPTMVSGSIKSNVLPIEARAMVNFRIHPRDSIESVVAHVRQVIADDSIQIIQGEASPASSVASATSEAFSTMAALSKQIYGDVLVVPGLTLGATDSRYYQEHIPNAYRFNPMVLHAEDSAGFHGSNERMSLENLRQASRFYYQLLAR